MQWPSVQKGIETFLNALLSPLNAFHKRWRINMNPGHLSSHITVVDFALCTFTVTHCWFVRKIWRVHRMYVGLRTQRPSARKTFCACLWDFVFKEINEHGPKNNLCVCLTLHALPEQVTQSQSVLRFYNMLLVCQGCCVSCVCFLVLAFSFSCSNIQILSSYNCDALISMPTV